MTRWLALLLRLCALYLVWCAVVDIWSVYNTLRLTGILSGSDGPPAENAVATLVYRSIAISLFLHVLGAVILWVKCLAIARIITRDIDLDEPLR